MVYHNHMEELLEGPTRIYNPRNKRIWFKLDITDYEKLTPVLPDIISYLGNTFYDKMRVKQPGDKRTEHERWGNISKEEVRKTVINLRIMLNTDLTKKNEKPRGLNYEGFPRLIFPCVDKEIEFYVDFWSYENMPVPDAEKRKDKSRRIATYNEIVMILDNNDIDFEILEDRLQGRLKREKQKKKK